LNSTQLNRAGLLNGKRFP